MKAKKATKLSAPGYKVSDLDAAGYEKLTAAKKKRLDNSPTWQFMQRPDIVKMRTAWDKKAKAAESKKEREIRQLIRDEIKAVVTSRTFIRALKQSLKA